MCSGDKNIVFNYNSGSFENAEPFPQDDNFWADRLLVKEFEIMRKKGTERAFDNEYNNNKKYGLYVCKGCGNHLFHSGDKFNSGTGWPSFTNPVHALNVRLNEDNSHFMQRTEVVCSVCGAHLGHVFNDGPEPAGRRYCMNSASMKFIEGIDET
ncbi:MAG: peptide-methionine (R)-S-oxide reductase MsrB [Spirochaetes bacterium]|nr:peptide-methionine (R)-S-oxide reductase MsrB [Spirochaetota bacterium]